MHDSSQWAPSSHRCSIGPLAIGTVAYVAEHMREADYREACALRHDESRASIAVDTVREWGPIGAVLGLERPICVIGAHERWPRVWTGFMYATDEFPRIGKSTTRYLKNVLLPAIRRLGMIRADAQSVADHVAAHRWLELTGAHRDVDLKCFGKNGEDFVLFRWT